MCVRVCEPGFSTVQVLYMSTDGCRNQPRPLSLSLSFSALRVAELGEIGKGESNAFQRCSSKEVSFSGLFFSFFVYETLDRWREGVSFFGVLVR